jgi:hypothetical protein
VRAAWSGVFRPTVGRVGGSRRRLLTYACSTSIIRLRPTGLVDHSAGHNAWRRWDQPYDTFAKTMDNFPFAEQWVMDEQRGLDGGSASVLAAFAAQRARFLRIVAGLDARQWQSQSRCVDWSVHDVIRHVRDGVKIHVATLAGRPQPFGGLESFHPASSPVEWLAVSDGEPPHQTVAELTELVAEEALLLGVTAEQAPKATSQSILRRDVHWSVWSIHVFWDAWTHERDLSSALALVPDYGPGELRMATMYSLLAAATPAARSRDYVRTIVLLKGSPDGRYEIAEDGGSVRITSSACSTEELIGPADQVLDSLSGRGPHLRELLSGPSAEIEKLALLRVGIAGADVGGGSQGR